MFKTVRFPISNDAGEEDHGEINHKNTKTQLLHTNRMAPTLISPSRDVHHDPKNPSITLCKWANSRAQCGNGEAEHGLVCGSGCPARAMTIIQCR